MYLVQDLSMQWLRLHEGRLNEQRCDVLQRLQRTTKVSITVNIWVLTGGLQSRECSAQGAGRSCGIRDM